MIQTAPLLTNERMRDYAKMLFIRYAKFHFISAIEVHIVFDNPGGLLSHLRRLNKDDVIPRQMLTNTSVYKA